MASLVRILSISLLFLCFKNGQANVQCWVNGAVNLNFDAIKYSSPTTATSSLNYACQIPWDPLQSTYYIRLCNFINMDPISSGVAPRYLQHWDNSKMKYDLYSDVAHTQILGPVQSSYPIESWVRTDNHNSQLQGILTIYGQVPAKQGDLRPGTYESHFMGGLIRWRWSRDYASLPNEQACQLGIGGEGGGEVSYYLNVTALANEACFIQTVSDLDFGVHTHKLPNKLDSQAAIAVRCPLSVNWMLSLNNGLYSQGGQRYMKHYQGDTIAYGLYRDAGRTQPWGNISDGTAVSGVGAGLNNETHVFVYGQIPVQPVNLTGEYTDTITITLSY